MSETLKDKLYNYEVTPPARVWEEISADLDDASLEHSFPSTLYQMELAPPAGAWDRINSALEPTEAVVRQFRIPPFVRYAVAAAILAAAVLIGYRVFYHKPEETRLASEQPAKPINDKPDSGNGPVIEAPPVTAMTSSDQIVARIEQPLRSRRKSNNDNYSNRNSLIADNSLVTSALAGNHDQDDPEAAAHQDSKLERASRYILLMTPEGNIVRMSKKLGELVCCVSGQDQDDNCKTQLKEWRDKVVHSSSASPGSFMDILNMVTTLQGDK